MSVVEQLRWIFEKRPQMLLLPSFEFDGETDWQGGDGYYYRKWKSLDGMHSIFKTVSFGPKYGNRRSENIELYLVNGPMVLGKTNLMRVLAFLEPGAKEPEYNIYLDAIQENTNSCLFRSASYYGSNNGKISEPSSWSDPYRKEKYSFLEETEFRKKFIEEAKPVGIHHENELPNIIDVEKTAIEFLSQIMRMDFSKPKLIVPAA